MGGTTVALLLSLFYRQVYVGTSPLHITPMVSSAKKQLYSILMNCQ